MPQYKFKSNRGKLLFVVAQNHDVPRNVRHWTNRPFLFSFNSRLTVDPPFISNHGRLEGQKCVTQK